MGKPLQYRSHSARRRSAEGAVSVNRPIDKSRAITITEIRPFRSEWAQMAIRPIIHPTIETMSHLPTFTSRSYLIGISIALLSATLCSAAPKVPDFTKGEALDPRHKKKKYYDRALGPTGLWAEAYSESMDKGASRDARQFRITKVEPGSPADGKIQVGDVVLGAFGQNFDSDARKLLAAAIEKAEETNGNLSLQIWREGKTFDQALKLKVMGAYDPNNPFNCAYTDAVIDHMAAHTTRGNIKSFMPSMYSLGMLATGKEELMPKVRAYAHSLCIDPKTNEPITFEISSNGKRVWRTSYRLIFLAEYYLATGDKTVLPAIRTLGIGAAKAQSGVGSYGHRFSSRKPDGSYHGPLEGYGAINNASLSMLTGIVLAAKCGIEDPEVTAAIARGKRFFDFFVEHGGIPYGDHWAGTHYFENNGTSGLSAIVYGLMGDDRGQRFFSGMAVASAPTGREEGHQGCYWSFLWSELGAARSGKEGLNAAYAETRYLRTLERRWDGQVIDPSNIGPTKYGSRGDVTGERLLMMSLGRKNLYFTGKNMVVKNPLEGSALTSALAAGRLIYHPEARKALSEEQIFALLRHELPAARITAAKAMQEQNIKSVDRLIEMINDPDRYARYGACAGLAYAGENSKKAVDALLRRMVKDDDILFRYFAIDALCSGRNQSYGLYGAAADSIPVLLELASKTVPNDPRGHLCWRISEALFDGRTNLLKTYPPKTPEEEKLLVASLRQFLLNENGRARSAVPLDSLTKEQLSQLWEGIYEATKYNSPSGIMFSKRVRTSGMAVMAQHRIKEGLDLMLELSKERIVLTEENKWVSWFADTMFDVLPLYGRDALPVLDVVEQWPVLTGRGKHLADELPELRRQLQNAPEYKLISIHD